MWNNRPKHAMFQQQQPQPHAANHNNSSNNGGYRSSSAAEEDVDESLAYLQRYVSRGSSSAAGAAAAAPAGSSTAFTGRPTAATSGGGGGGGSFYSGSYGGVAGALPHHHNQHAAAVATPTMTAPRSRSASPSNTNTAAPSHYNPHPMGNPYPMYPTAATTMGGPGGSHSSNNNNLSGAAAHRTMMPTEPSPATQWATDDIMQRARQSAVAGPAVATQQPQQHNSVVHSSLPAAGSPWTNGGRQSTSQPRPQQQFQDVSSHSNSGGFGTSAPAMSLPEPGGATPAPRGHHTHAMGGATSRRTMQQHNEGGGAMPHHQPSAPPHLLSPSTSLYQRIDAHYVTPSSPPPPPPPTSQQPYHHLQLTSQQPQQHTPLPQPAAWSAPPPHAAAGTPWRASTSTARPPQQAAPSPSHLAPSQHGQQQQQQQFPPSSASKQQQQQLLDPANHDATLGRICSYLKNRYGRDASEEAKGIETMEPDDVLGLAQCFYVDAFRLVKQTREAEGDSGAFAGLSDVPQTSDIEPIPPAAAPYAPPPRQSHVQQPLPDTSVRPQHSQQGFTPLQSHTQPPPAAAAAAAVNSSSATSSRLPPPPLSSANRGSPPPPSAPLPAGTLSFPALPSYMYQPQSNEEADNGGLGGSQRSATMMTMAPPPASALNASSQQQQQSQREEEELPTRTGSISHNNNHYTNHSRSPPSSSTGAGPSLQQPYDTSFPQQQQQQGDGSAATTFGRTLPPRSGAPLASQQQPQQAPPPPPSSLLSGSPIQRHVRMPSSHKRELSLAQELQDVERRHFVPNVPLRTGLPHLRTGAMLLKYCRNAAPHLRYFAVVEAVATLDEKTSRAVGGGSSNSATTQSGNGVPQRQQAQVPHLSWAETITSSPSGQLPLLSLEEVLVGPVGPNSQRFTRNSRGMVIDAAKKPVQERLCFTLVFEERTLELCATSEEQFDLWVGTLQSVMIKNLELKASLA